MTIRVSVVVPTHKRNDLLERCLEKLMAQDLNGAEYEVIVADDAVSEQTERLVTNWSRRRQSPAVRYVAVSHAHGPAAARNAGWREASGEIIAFTDDDTLPDASWLRAGVGAFTDGVLAVSGRIVVPLPAVPTDYQRNEAGLERADFATANCFYRRSALEEAGGFDERFTQPWREDSDLFFTLLRRANGQTGRFRRVPEAIVVHPVRSAPWGISLSQQRKTTFNALLYKKHPVLYRRLIQSRPPWHYYSIVGALLAVVCGSLASSRHLAVSAVCAWAFLTAWFCGRRLKRTSRDPSHIAEMLLTSALIPPLAVYWRLRGALKFRVIFF
jgi:glycosyltransferase involved in cell wall biosynthesis